MEQKTSVFYNGTKIDSKYDNSLSKTILRLNLKKGDSFRYSPFNHDNTESSEYKGVFEAYHKELTIDKIEYEISDTWNGSVKSKIDIFLVDSH